MSGATTGGVRLVLRLEAAIVLGISLLAYDRFGAGWSMFVLFFLAPDLSFFGYLAGPRLGALAYNLAHSYLGPLMVLASGVFSGSPTALAGGLIWSAHVGFDRMLGYGLKYPEGFGFTHLGPIGRVRLAPDNARKPAPQRDAA